MIKARPEARRKQIHRRISCVTKERRSFAREQKIIIHNANRAITVKF